MAKKKSNRFFNSKLMGSEKKFAIIKILEMGISLMFIIFGILLLLDKSAGATFMAVFIGILLILESILNIYSTIMPESNKLFKINIVFGILNIIMAFLLFTNLIKFVNYVQIYYGIYLIISGIKYLITTVIFKVVREESWLMVLVTSILVISLGGLLMIYPFESFVPLETIAIFSILFGLLNINVSNLLKNRTKKILSKVDND